PFGGLERDFMEISRECLKRGHFLDIFAMQWEGEVPSGMNVTIIAASGMSNHKKVSRFTQKLSSHLARSAYDLVVGFNRIPGLDIYYAADVCYVKRITRQRSFLSRLTPRYRFFSAYEKAIFSPESSTDIIYLAGQEKSNYQAAYGTPDERFHYAPPGVDKQRIQSFLNKENRKKIREEFNLTEGDNFLLMIGSNFHTKGVDRSIQALALLPHHLKKSTYLFIIGNGDNKKYLALSKQLGAENHVRFLGGRDDVPRFLAGADLLLQPSVTENTGNAIVEALVAGIPVLATQTCGYAEHVTKAQAGKIISCNPFRQEQMNVLLIEMLTSPDRSRWRQNALAYAEQTDLYSRPVVVANLLEKIADSKRPFH
ncbi:MAG: glycosyltransferase family 4 protein, partial [Desulfobulbaceae bacterium]|nr:glycosyltransferase family 4 protein [Desulfobulbaceae bacterium]